MSKRKARRRSGAPILLASVDAEELLAAIRAKCTDCCCGSKKMVKHCKDYDCRLYPYRNCFAMVQTDMFRTEE